MRVLLSTYGSRGEVEPMVGLSGRLRVLGAKVWACAPPDFAALLACVGAPLVPVGQSVRPMVHGAPTAANLSRRLAELVTAVAEGCDALAADGMMPTGRWR